MRLPELKSEYIWAVMMIFFLIPAIHPIGLPFPMDPVTYEVYNIIESLPEGSIVVMGGGGVFAFDLESSAGMIAMIKQMARKGLRLVTCPVWTEAPQFHKYVIDAARVDKDKYGGPWEYGVDYVLLPYMPGGDMVVFDSFLKDVHATVSVDLAGTPIDELPLMQDLHDYHDIALWICPHWGFVSVIRIVAAQYGITCISPAQSTAYAFFSPFMEAYPGKVYMLNGYVGGAQYEALVGIKGLGHKVMDSYAFASTLIVLFIVLGNITMLSRMGGEEE
ncbi:hypothetical protein DRO56_00655 [Candidatus Bathyarchaeota archaeon]|nr:MAG: 2-hydroxyacyl-CoA dehydratase [Candidatus Bathyarchaeota archaeon]RLI33851.1 MAG: hypothetical protein DRO56_00655 [Candidatus Bathyarchaeota archaeon]